MFWKKISINKYIHVYISTCESNVSMSSSYCGHLFLSYLDIYGSPAHARLCGYSGTPAWKGPALWCRWGGGEAQRGSALPLPGLSPWMGASAAALHPPRQGSQPQPPPRGPAPVTVQPRPFISALPTVVPLQLWNLLWLSLSPTRCSGASEPWPLL